MNEYIVYWRRETLYRTKVLAESEEEALNSVIVDSDNNCHEDIDEYGDMEIDNIELIEENAE